MSAKNPTKSPDVSKMQFFIHDPKMKTTVYFTSLDRKEKYIERMNQPPEKPIGRNYKKKKDEKDHSDRD